MQYILDTIVSEGQVWSFIDFLELSEAIAPRPTDYSEFQQTERGFASKFNSGGETFVVLFDKTQRPGWVEIGFAKLIHGKNPDKIDPENYSMLDQVKNSNAFETFGKVIYIASEYAKKHQVDRFRFVGAYEKLARFYKTLVMNKKFNDNLNKLGFELDVEMTQRYGNILVIKKI